MKVVKRSGTVLAVAGLVLAGAVLRLPITMMPPILGDLKDAIGLPTSWAGLLTTIPLLMFALVSPLIGRLGSRHGNEFTLMCTLALLTIGSYMRIIPTSLALMVGTAVVGIGIAGGNVLLPAVIKERFVNSTASKTTLYTTVMGLMASVGTAASGVLAGKVGLQSAIALLSLVAPLALAVWFVVWVGDRKADRAGLEGQAVDVARNAASNSTHGEAAGNTVETSSPRRSPWRSPLAWVILAFFGLQSVIYYSLVTWMPSVWQAKGFSPAAASTLATILQLLGMPMTLSVPTIAKHQHGMAWVNAIIAGCYVLAIAGLLMPGANMTLNVVCAVLMGLAQGAAFSICIVFFQRRASSADDTARLSGMAQSGGYVLAAIGPVAFGWVDEALHSWTPVIVMVFVLVVLLFVAGVVIIKHRDIYERRLVPHAI